MLKRFEKLLEIAKNDEELEKALEYGLDKVENTINIRAYKTECSSLEEARKIAKKIFSDKLIDCVKISSVKLMNDELGFTFILNGGDLVCRYNVKDYSFIGLEMFYDEEFFKDKNIAKEKLKKVLENFEETFKSLDKNENKILCDGIIWLVQKEITKDYVLKLSQEIDNVIKDIENIPNDSACDVESNCDSVVEDLEDFKKEFSDLLKIKLI